MARISLGNWLLGLARGVASLGEGFLGASLWLVAQAERVGADSTEARGWHCFLSAPRVSRRGSPDGAVRLLREAVACLPREDMVIATLGVELSGAGQHEDAVQVIERAIRGETDVTTAPQLWTALAWSYLRTGRAPMAIRAYERAQDAHAVSPEVRAVWLLAQASHRGFVQRDRLVEAARLYPRVTPLITDYARDVARRRDYPLARQLFRCLPDPAARRSLEMTALVAMDQEDAALAGWALKQAESIAPRWVMGHVLRSELALREADHNGALRSARVAEVEAPRDGHALAQLVRVRAVRGEWEEAVEAAQRAILARTRDAMPAGVLALHKLETGQVREAEKLFSSQRSGDRLACLFAQSAQALIAAQLGDCERSLDIAASAVSHFERLPGWAAKGEHLRRPLGALRDALALAADRLCPISREQAEDLLARLPPVAE